MSATYTYVTKYDIDAICTTPFRTGGTEADTETVLRNSMGQPFIQGTSIAGAMRDQLKKIAAVSKSSGTDKDISDILFGSQTAAGRLIVSEGMFQGDYQQHSRPRVCIDGETGTAADSGKFDIAHIGTGAKFTFEITWLGSREYLNETEIVERLFSEFNNGDIRLGAQKTNGFGKLSLTVRKAEYDLKNKSDLMAWLDGGKKGKEIIIPKVISSEYVEFSVKAFVDNVLVKSAFTKQTDNGSYTPNISEDDVAIIPASSIKGAIRSRVRTIAGILNMSDAEDRIFGSSKAVEGGESENGKPGTVYFEDIRISTPKKQKISRIRINKFTGGVIRQGLFAEEPLSSELEIGIFVPSEDAAACALMTYALRDLGIGLYNIGSGSAIGRGYLKVHKIDILTPENKRAVLSFDADRNVKLEDANEIVSHWINEMGGAQ